MSIDKALVWDYQSMYIHEETEITRHRKVSLFLSGRGIVHLRTEPGEYRLTHRNGDYAGEASLSQGHLVVMTDEPLRQQRSVVSEVADPGCVSSDRSEAGTALAAHVESITEI